jgi:hypothetical protein
MVLRENEFVLWQWKKFTPQTYAEILAEALVEFEKLEECLKVITIVSDDQ